MLKFKTINQSLLLLNLKSSSLEIQDCFDQT
uniref:Uncharacterized protein n=1 Tax=Rhizophora mucronata TaxID=61149 RepID=A0A2P2PE79_RHIMU